MRSWIVGSLCIASVMYLGMKYLTRKQKQRQEQRQEQGHESSWTGFEPNGRTLADCHEDVTAFAEFLETFRTPGQQFTLPSSPVYTIDFGQLNRANREYPDWRARVVWSGLNSAKIVAAYPLGPKQSPPVLAIIENDI